MAAGDLSFNSQTLFDPYASSQPSSTPETVDEDSAADDSFFAALHPSSASHSAQTPIISLSTSQSAEDLLIDFAPTPRPLSNPLVLSSLSTRRVSGSAPLPSATKRPSPLQFSFFDDSIDETNLPASPPAIFLHREGEEMENEPVQAKRRTGTKWGTASQGKEGRSRRKSRSLSPVKDWGMINEGNSSMILSPQNLGAGEVSLIADEGGSFLISSGHTGEITLDSFALPRVAEELEEEEAVGGSVEETASGGMSQLLRGLGESTVQKERPTFVPKQRQRRMPTSHSVPSLSSILPPSLTSSSRPALSRSLSLSRSTLRAAAELPPPPPIDAEFEPSSTLIDYEISGVEPSFLGAVQQPTFLDPSFIAGTCEPSFFAAPDPSFAAPSVRSRAAAEASFALNATRFDVDDEVAAGAGEAIFLDVSTASFKDYRDSPVKPRIASVQAERWMDEGDEDEDFGKTPRPTERQKGKGRVSDVSSSGGEEGGSSGSSFDITAWRQGECGTLLFNQPPPIGADRPESTATLLLSLQTPLRPTLASIFDLAPSEQPDLLSCSTNTAVPDSHTPRPASPNTSVEWPFSTVSVPVGPAVVPEGDLLGIGNVAPSPPRLAASVEDALAPSRVTTLGRSVSKGGSGADRLKRRLEELRAQKQQSGEGSSSSTSFAATPRHRRTASSATLNSNGTPAAPHPFAAVRPSTAMKPNQTMTASRSASSLDIGASSSAAPKPSAASRLARAGPSALPTSSSSSSLASRNTTPPRASSSTASSAVSRTPGERKDSTRARLERMKEERVKREQQRSVTPELAPAPIAIAAGAGLARRGSMVQRRTSMVAPAGRGMAASKSVGDLRPSAPPSSCLATSSGLIRPSSRNSTAPPPSFSRLAPATARPRQSLSRAPTSSSSSAPSLLPSAQPSTKRAAPTKLQFSSMPPPKARVPLKGIQPGGLPPSTSTAMGGTGKVAKPRESRIGLGRRSLAGVGGK